MHAKPNFLGMGTVGERGQIVVPAAAREAYKINSGDKFVFFGYGEVIGLIKSDQLDGFLSKIADKFNSHIEELKQKIKTEENGSN